MKPSLSIADVFSDPRPWIVLLAGSALTFLGTWAVYSVANDRQQAAVNAAISTSLGALSKQLDAYGSVLESTRSFVTSTPLNRMKFAAFIGGLELTERFPGLQGIGFAPVVASGSDVAMLRQRAIFEGLIDYKVWSDGDVPARSAILYLEPMDARNRAALGFDMMSQPQRRRAMERAAQTGRLALSEHVRLKQDAASPARQLGFLIYLPVYDADQHSDTNSRWKLSSFVYSAVRAGDFFRALFEGSGQQLAVEVSDVSTDGLGRALYTSAHFASQRSSTEHARTYEYGGQQWSLKFRPVAGSSLAQRTWILPAGVATLGAVVTLFLMALIGFQASRRRATAKHAHELEEALRRETQLRAVAQSLSSLALETGSETDIDRLVQRITERATELTGAAFGAYFHNKPDAQGRYGLYALAGAPSAAFDKFPPLRATPLFAATFGGQTVRLYDVRESPLFGRNPPYDGLPPGHLAVTSYLGVCVRARSGEALGGFFLGHPEPGRFLAEHEQLVEGMAALAGVALESIQFLNNERQARLEAQERRALLDLVVENSGEGIIVADESGTLRIFNPAAERQHGASGTQVAAPDWADTYGLLTIEGQPLALNETPLFRAVQGEMVDSAAWKVKRPDGTVTTLSGSASPLRRADGSSAGAVLIARDDTERLKREDEREHLVQELMRTNADLDQFAYVASHDLKAPLRGIAALSQWVEEDLGRDVPQAVQEHMKLLRGRVFRMEALIDGILAYSRAGRQAADTADVSLSMLVGEVIDLLQAPAHVQFDVQGDLPVLRGSKIELEQVLLNLISNAIKHAGAGTPVVRISAQELLREWRIGVGDNGVGIDPKYHERIWGMFQMLQSRDKVEGTGIGLAIVRKIVNSRGGRTWVESSLGHGACFYFTWPKTPNLARAYGGPARSA